MYLNVINLEYNKCLDDLYESQPTDMSYYSIMMPDAVPYKVFYYDIVPYKVFCLAGSAVNWANALPQSLCLTLS